MTSTKIVKIDPFNPQENYLKEAAQILSEGGLVILPTETVYGIAANSLNPKAVARLFEIKKRPKDKSFSLLIAQKENIEEFARNIPRFAYKLMAKFWPGPLTVILKAKTEGTIGIRIPDNKIALKIISLLGAGVACPSANISGLPAAVKFEDAIKDLYGLVDFAIDAGPAKLGVESSVVDCAEGCLKIMREGAIKKEAIETAAGKKTVLFVCTGNSCRSVMAQALLEKKLKEKNRDDVEVLSAGIMMLSGLGASEFTKEILKKEGMDVSCHRSQRATKGLLRKSDIILVMEKIHEKRILEEAPDVKNRLFLLKEFAKIDDNNLDILDPIAASEEFYEETYMIIKQAVERVNEII
ncbi:MAG: L-threonylcarbamoyladenylate synthase [Candidatus Omnitrophota bacterium]|nr:L-threonylcarbamoyladenylate synthase [Candidatus Omnitrophota bacterium]